MEWDAVDEILADNGTLRAGSKGSARSPTRRRDYLAACMRFPACDVAVLWEFTDKESWIPSTFPGFGDALIFDSAYQPKSAFFSLQTQLE